MDRGSHARTHLYLLPFVASTKIYNLCFLLLWLQRLVLLGDHPFHLRGQPCLIFFLLRQICLSPKIDGRVLGISTFTGLVIGSVSQQKEINMQMNEEG